MPCICRSAPCAGSSRTARCDSVLIVGPGMDLAPRTGFVETHAPQSYQPFAVIDALMATGLSQRETLRVTAADINPRVVEWLTRARRYASDAHARPWHLRNGVGCNCPRTTAIIFPRSAAPIGAELADVGTIGEVDQLRRHRHASTLSRSTSRSSASNARYDLDRRDERLSLLIRC